MRGPWGALASGAGVACLLSSVGCSPRAASPTREPAARHPSAPATGNTTKPPSIPPAALGYAPLAAQGLDLIQKSPLSLDRAEQARLARDGFVLSHRRVPTFGAGLAQIYKNDLPLYVSADSILDAVHRSYDNLLMWTERAVLKPELQKLLGNMQGRLSSGAAQGFSAQARADVDDYLGVTRALLDGKPPRALGGGNVAGMQKIVDRAKAAAGMKSAELFGSRRTLDFSQFKPRGHYARTDLESYFRAVIWLGRVDLRILDFDQHGRAELDRRQLEDMLLLRVLLDRADLARYKRVDYALGTFIGPRDYAGPDALDRLLSKLSVKTPHAALALGDDALTRAILQTGFGTQRIASHIRHGSLTNKPRPQARSFALLGQRYIVDSEVLANVVADRVPGRMMPKPLDVAYAALGNDQAKPLLAGDLKNARYAQALSAERKRVDGLGSAYWTNTLYTSWFGALRRLSPGDTTGLPKVARSEAWGLRILGTQLSSWAELRHDVVAYAKQSYTVSALCEFPAAYVDPYPQFFAALQNFAKNVQALAPIATAAGAAGFDKKIGDYATTLDHSLGMLQDMAERERRGEDLSKDDLAFINDAVVIHQLPGGCGPGPRILNGWYPKMLFGADPLKPETPIADVHTQPTDAAGNPVGRILHVATAAPELFVVTVDTCKGPATFAGLASPYYEVTTEHFHRLDDSEWGKLARKHPQASFLAPIVGGVAGGK